VASFIFTAVPAINGVPSDNARNHNDDDDEASPLLQGSINGSPSYQSFDQNSVSPDSDRLVQVTTRLPPNTVNPSVV